MRIKLCTRVLIQMVRSSDLRLRRSEDLVLWASAMARLTCDVTSAWYVELLMQSAMRGYVCTSSDGALKRDSDGTQKAK